jgi:RNA-binding protein
VISSSAAIGAASPGIGVRPFAYTAGMAPLPPKRRSELRAEAHKLSPVVLIGDKGLTDEVLAEIDRSLKAHELIKVRASSGERDARDVWLETICDRLQAHAVQQIGKVFVIYREKPEEQVEAKSPKAEDKRRPRGGLTERGREAQRARDAEKQKLRDIEDMKRKGKIGRGPRAAVAAEPGGKLRADEDGGDARATGSARPRSRTPSPRPASEPRRRRPRTSR